MPTEPILQLLENGKWHYLKDIPKLTSINSTKVEQITKFLAKYNFVQLDETKQKIRLEQTTTTFFKMLQNMEQMKE